MSEVAAAHVTPPDVGRSIGFLGGGHMGRALVAALRGAGVAGSRIIVFDTQAATRDALQGDFGIRVADDASAHIASIDLLVLAVKPQDMAAALRPLKPALARHRPLVISVAAGLGTQQLAELCGDQVPLVRAMPNRPALLGAGATGAYADPTLEPAYRRRAETVLGAAGCVVWVEDEALMDVVTAVSGSGPAYFFRMAEALAAAGIAQGLPAAAANELAVATLHGAGLMASRGANLTALRESVTSKGGTTAAALAQFTAQGFEQGVADAVAAAVTRGRQMAAQYGTGS
ncbi:MAG: pyrroline-5-carboxylate reductase [Steroidobacteraceae bacterium]|jgi:pyrroline-5-carboxylate reductase